RLFGVETTQVTADMRRLAKTVNFGVIYGMSGYGLEQATELSREEAEKFIKSYFEQYPAVKSYMESVKEQARAKGYVSTMLGKRRYIDDMTSRNRNAREAAERMAINMPVQGGSADIIKVAMVNISAELKKKKLMSKLLLQVHDELILEVPQAELNVIKELVPRLMSEAIELKVPLKADVKIGENWGQLE
ncbi:MAG: DNA polymerase I, partial [Chloroflexi bacterium]|nr:DNA polymerase I [Chloroflexota bacterium]